jgi:hypothetical protein
MAAVAPPTGCSPATRPRRMAANFAKLPERLRAPGRLFFRGERPFHN